MPEVSYMKRAHSKKDIESIMHPLVKEWFFKKFDDFSPPQTYGVKEVHDKNNILISAATGSGKTLTAFLSIINELVTLSVDGKLDDRVYAVYISPLKALSNDISVNLEKPLMEIKEIAKEKSINLNIRVGLRTGDTKPSERQKMLKKPPHILITTPESFALMLSSIKFKELLYSAHYCIIDEIHNLAENKRGVHLSLSLERLQVKAPNLARIGLSATVEPIEEVAKFLVGTNRSCKIAKLDMQKKMDIQVISPVSDLVNLTHEEMHDNMYEVLDGLIQKHKTTLIFTNTRAGTERVVHHLKDKFPKNYTENIGAHHGSLSKGHRQGIEERLRKGELKAVVCSSSLELGIDIGYIDLVICIGSPKSVARLSQRLGRSGHELHKTIKGRVIVMDRDDLVECSVLLKHTIEKNIDRIHIPMNCLDVLAQQIHGMAVTDIWNVDELYSVIKESYCYGKLTREDYDEIVDYLAGEFVDLEERWVFAKIWHDKEKNLIGKKGRLGRVLHMTNVGTIPDTGGIQVKIKDATIGMIDEGFLERIKRGDVFVLGGETYEFLFARGMVAQVKHSGGRLPTVPSWFGESLPLNFDLAMSIEKFRRYLEDLFVNNKDKKDIIDYIHNYLYVDENAANAIYEYFYEQYKYALIPHERRLLIEFYHSGFDEEKKYVVFHSLYGRRVNDVLSRAIAYALSKIQKRDVEVGINDNGFYIASSRSMQAMRALEVLKPDELRRVMELAIEKTEVLKRRFRHCAGRAMMILRNYKGKHKRAGRQQVSSMILLNAVKKINKNFCVLKEAKREVLEDLMDIENACKILTDVKLGNIEVEQIHTSVPSPFALQLVTQGATDIMKMEDRIEFIKRMHSMTMAKIGKKSKI